MGENKEYVTRPEEMGSINISEDVVAAIAAEAAAEIEGVTGLVYGTNVRELLGRKNMSKGVKLEINDGAVTIDVYIMVRFGCAIQDIAKNVQSAVISAVESMTELAVPFVNVHIGGVSFEKED